jgi:hypothetical protein
MVQTIAELQPASTEGRGAEEKSWDRILGECDSDALSECTTETCLVVDAGDSEDSELARHLREYTLMAVETERRRYLQHRATLSSPVKTDESLTESVKSHEEPRGRQLTSKAAAGAGGLKVGSRHQ